MTRRLSSSTRSHTEDSIFLRPDEDPVWLDEPTKTDKLVDGLPQNDILPKCKDSIPVEQSPQGEEVFMRKVYALVVEIHCWVALFAISQVTVSHLNFKKKKKKHECGSKRVIFADFYPSVLSDTSYDNFSAQVVLIFSSACKIIMTKLK